MISGTGICFGPAVFAGGVEDRSSSSGGGGGSGLSAADGGKRILEPVYSDGGKEDVVASAECSGWTHDSSHSDARLDSLE